MKKKILGVHSIHTFLKTVETSATTQTLSHTKIHSFLNTIILLGFSINDRINY